MSRIKVLLQVILGCLVLSVSANGRTIGSRDTGVNGWNKEPGFKSQISQSGLDFLRDVGLESLKEDIQKLTIPDQHGRASVKIGHADYDITHIRITSFTIHTSSLTTDPKAGGLTLRASGISLNVNANWHYKASKGFIHISDHGSFDAGASGISLTVTLRIGVDSTGRPAVSSQPTDCSFHVEHLKVKFHGGASWLYNLFDSKIASSLKKSLDDTVCKTILDDVNTDIENNLKTLKVVAPFDNVAEIDYSLVAKPTFNGSINTAHKGETYPLRSRTECPLPVPKIAPDFDSSRMLFLWITEFLPNSAGYVLQNNGYLQYNVTPDNVPDGKKYLLNTSNFAFDLVLPQINLMYPNMAMQINVNSTKAPVVKITPDGIQVVLVGNVSPYAILPNKTLAYLFTLSVTITGEVTADLKNNSIVWKITKFDTDMSTVRSAIGFIFTPALQFSVNTAINLYFIPYLNVKGATGAPLPRIDNYELVNSVISQGKGFLKIGGDLKYRA